MLTQDDLAKIPYEEFSTLILQEIERKYDNRAYGYSDKNATMNLKLTEVIHSINHMIHDVGLMTELMIDIEHGNGSDSPEVLKQVTELKTYGIPSVMRHLMRVSNILGLDLGAAYIEYIKDGLEVRE